MAKRHQQKEPGIHRRLPNGLTHPLPPALCLTVIVTLIAGLRYEPILGKLARRTLFFATAHDAWLAFTAPRPGEFLDYLSRGLTTLGLRPALGIGALALLSAGVTALWCFAFRRSRAAQLLAPLPALFFLCQLGHLGFSVYLFKQTSFPFLHLLGLACALLLYLLWQHARRFAPSVPLLAAALYPPLGVPALFANGLIAVHALVQRRWAAASAALLLTGAVPGLCAEFLYGAYAFDTAYTVNAILLFEEQALWWNIAAGAILAAAALCAIFNALRLNLSMWIFHPVIFLFPFLSAAALAFFTAEKDTQNLFAIIRAEAHAERGDWKALLNIPTPKDREPHRTLTAYRILALFRTGALPERLLAYPIQTKHTTTSIDTMKIDGFRLLYHYGLVQIARKWCWEKTEDLSWTPDTLLYLGRIALITGELDAARAWFTLLARCPFYGKEAAEGLRLSKDPAARVEDPELLTVYDLFTCLSQDPANPVFEKNHNVEDIIYNRYAIMRKANETTLHLHLAANLLLNNPRSVLENLETLLRLRPDPTRPLPRYYQEALLTALAEIPAADHPRTIPPDAFDPAVVQRFQRFQRDARRLLAPGTTPADREAFSKTYRDAYPFYKGFQP